jgi:hypothetical protein
MRAARGDDLLTRAGPEFRRLDSHSRDDGTSAGGAEAGPRFAAVHRRHTRRESRNGRLESAAASRGCRQLSVGETWLCANHILLEIPAIRLVDLATAKDGAGAFRLKAIVW